MSEEVLALDDIQGNSLAGFNKPYQTFVALEIGSPGDARAYVRSIAGSVTSLRSAVDHKLLRRALTHAVGFVTNRAAVCVLNVLLSAVGLRKLQYNPESLGDAVFVLGMESRARALGDAPTATVPGAPANWLFGTRAAPADVMLVIGSEDPAIVARSVQSLIASAEAANLRVIWQGDGQRRRDLPGHEHFGFNDGISQPGIRGLRSAVSTDYFEPRLLDPHDPSLMDPTQPEYAAPGKPLIWPGSFVFGYRRQSETDPRGWLAPLDVPRWAHNGSLVVIRRLRQDVAGFEVFAATAAATAGISADLLKAQLVGRWPSGAPIMRYPHAEPGDQAGNAPAENNAFAYQFPYGPLKLADGTAVAAAPADMLGARCPFAAHIRKVNPRDGATDEQSPVVTLSHRILRRGITYGEPFSIETSHADRGLIFVCYQTSLVKQFEFLQTNWMNRPDRPNGGGYDLIVGQNASVDRERTAVIAAPNGAIIIRAMSDFIVATGGEYLFSPSLSFLHAV